MKNDRRGNACKTAFWIWLLVSLLIAASIEFIYLRLGPAGFELFIATGPHSILPITMISVALTWLLAGIYLYLFSANRIQDAFQHAGFLLVALIYLNVMRERNLYGDIEYYIEAGKALLNGSHLPDTYYYPPLWAAILKYLVPHGDEFTLALVWTLNMLSLFVFYFLLHKVLEKYGFSTRLATLTTVLFMLVNSTILRTLGYMQVNLHMMNLILLSMLLFRKSNFWSALCMALAVYLKASPAVLVLAFLLELDWRWTAWAAFHMLWITALLVWLNGTGPFYDFLSNYAHLTQTHIPTFHDSSFDSLFLATAQFSGLSHQAATYLAYAAKGLSALAVFLLLPRAIHNKVFYSSGENVRLYNSLPPLSILMLVGSPLVWEHHGIMLTLPFLLMLKRLETASGWLWFGLAYFLQYLLPTFDFFPWSYARTFAPLILLWLLWRSEKESPAFARWNQWAGNLALPKP